MPLRVRKKGKHWNTFIRCEYDKISRAENEKSTLASEFSALTVES